MLYLKLKSLKSLISLLDVVISHLVVRIYCFTKQSLIDNLTRRKIDIQLSFSHPLANPECHLQLNSSKIHMFPCYFVSTLIVKHRYISNKETLFLAKLSEKKRLYWNGFQLSNESRSNLRLFWLCFTTLCDWSRKLAPFSQPIRYKTKAIELLAHVSPHLILVTCTYSLNCYYPITAQCLRSVKVLTNSSSYLLIVLLASVVVSVQSIKFDFGFKTLN